MPLGGAGLKLGGGGLLLILVLSVLTGTNPLDLIGGLEEAGSPPAIDSGPEREPPTDDPQGDYSSVQRVRWFRTGLDTGDVRRCDTFAARP